MKGIFLQGELGNVPASPFGWNRAWRLRLRGLSATIATVLASGFLTSSLQASVELMPLTSAWRFEQTTNLDGIGWWSLGYDDSNWPTGGALLYVENNILVSPRNTPLTIGRTTYYFRTHFNVPFAPTNAYVTFSSRIDDGAVFYLNGREVQRVRMSVTPTPIFYSTLATGSPSSGDAISADAFTLTGNSLTNFVAGDNVLAAEVHQNVANSDDIVFGTSITWNFTNAAPVVVSQPVDVSVLDGRAAALIAFVDGNPTPTRQWFKDGQPVPGTTGNFLSFTATHPTNSGTYWLAASNIFDTATTSNAVLTVLADTNPPIIVSAVAQKNLTNILVTFSEPVRSASATNTGNYAVFQTSVPSSHLDVLGLSLSGNSAVTLRTVPRAPGLNYSLRVNGIQDISSVSNVIAPDSEVALSYRVDLIAVDTLTTWSYFQAGAQPASNWTSSSYDDSAWPVGAALFHAGTPLPGAADPVRTALSLTNGGNAVQTFYFRTTFSFPGPVDTNSLRLHDIADDGAVFYLNGNEAFSIGMPTNRPVAYATAASRTVGTPNYEPALTATGSVIPGTNIVTLQNSFAAEVHQSAFGFSDVAFGAILDAVITRFYPPLQLSAPALLLEGAGTLTNAARISILEPLTADLVLQTSSTRPADIGVPAQVTIPAGATNVEFDLVVSDDAMLNGPRTVVLTVESPGEFTASTNILFLDNETNTLNISIASSMMEGSSSLSGGLHFAQAAVADIAVNLTSSDVTELTVPPTVLMPAGATSVLFQVTVVDDAIIDGSQPVTLSASVAGWQAALAGVTVNDNESTNITVILPISVVEGAGALVATGKVQLAGIAVSNLTVTLNSSLPTLVTVTPSITLNAGQSNATFDLTLVDNPLHEPSRAVVISAAISGFTSGSNTLTVLDDDTHHFVFDRIPSPQYTNAPFMVTITALTAEGGRQTNFTFTGLAANGQSGEVLLQPTNVGPFVGGVWTGTVQVLTADRFVRLETLAAPGLSDFFYVEPAPYRVVDLHAEDLIYDPVRQIIYASVPSIGGVYSNSVTAIDPVTGVIVWSLPVGPIVRPELAGKYRSGKLARSGDGQFLYVAVSNAIAVQRVNLTSQSLGPVFSVGAGVFGDALSVADLVVLHGAPTSVAVAMSDAYNSKGVALYDNGVRRANTTGLFPSVNALEPAADGNTLYGYNGQGGDQTSGFDFIRLSVSASGVSVQDTTQGWLYGFNSDIAFDGGLVFGSFGAVIEPLAPSLVGRFNVESSFPNCCKYVAPDTAMGRAFFLTQVGSNFHLQAHDLDTFLALKALEIPPDGGGGRVLVRWGTNGLAFATTAGKIYLVQSSLLMPSDPPVDLVVTQTLTGTPVAGSNFTISVTVSNRGTEFASEVVMTDALPPNNTLASVFLSQGSWSTNAGKLAWSVGMLPPGSNATASITMSSPVGGWQTNRITVVGNEFDPNLTNNVSAEEYFVQVDVRPNSVSQIVLPANDLAYDPASQRLFASVPNRFGAHGNAVLILDPTHGNPTGSLFVGNEPGRFALSENYQYLYVAANTNYSVSRIDLASQSVGLQFALGGPQSLQDMAVLPGQPQSIAISHGPLAVYDNGIPRTNTGEAPSHYYSDVIEFGADASMIFVHNSGAIGFNRMSVDAQGVTFLDSDSELLGNFTTIELEFAEGLLYSTSGLVIDPLSRTSVGQIPGITSGAAVLFDPPTRRIYYLQTSGTNCQLLAFEAGSFIPLGSIDIGGVSGTPSSLTRWGADGFAFRTSDDQLFILRSSIVPSGPPADLAVTATMSTNLVGVNSNFTYTIVVSNSGPNAASNAVAFHKLPATVTYVSGNSSAGVPVFSNGLVSCAIGTLTNGGSATVQITARTAVGGMIESLTSVACSAVDPNLSNNVFRLTAQAVLNLTPNSYGQIAMNVQDIAYNPFVGRLYASGGSNHISVLDPYSGLSVAAWPLPSRPGLLRLSDDGDLLYCTLNSGKVVARLATSSGLVDFDLPINFVVSDLEPMPGVPDSFVLARAGNFWRVVEVYDGMVPRPLAPDDSSGARDLEFGSTTNVIYAVGSALSGGSRYRVMTISNNGIAETVWNESVPFALGRLEFDDGVLYAATGEILDPPTGSVIAKFAGPGTGSLVEAEVARQRVFFLNKSNTTWRVQAYEPRTLALLGSVTVSNVLGNPTTLLRWGDDGLAFCTSSNQIFLLRTSLVPSGAPADLGLTQSVSPDPVMLGSNATFVITVTNAGPNTVSNAVLFDRFPTNALFVSATVSQGSASQAAGLVTCALGTLTNGASAQMQLTVQPLVAGGIINLAAVTSGMLDTSTVNNSSTLQVRVQLNLGANGSGVIVLNTADIAYEPVSGLIYATLTDYYGPPFKDALITIDPATGLLGEPLPMGKPLSRLAVTDDGSRLYVLANGGDEFLRVNLTNRLVDLSVPGLPLVTYDIKSVPGSPESLVLIRNAGVVVYDNAVPRPDSLIWFDQVEFYGLNELIGFWQNSVPTISARLGLTSGGVYVLSPWVSYLIDGTMSASGGLIYTSGGSAFDPVTMAKIRSFGVTGPVAPDSAVDRVAFLTGAGSSLVLRLFDTHNLLEWGSLSISNIVGTPDRLIRCGADRFAFRTSGGQVFIVRSSAIPTGNPSELALGASPNDLVATVGQAVELLLTVTNSGPTVATGLIISNTLPPSMQLVAATSSHGSTTITNRELRWQIASLGVGAAATNRVTLIPDHAGIFTCVTVLRSEAKDTNSTDNVTRQTWRINNLPAVFALSQLTLRAADLLWEPVSQQLLMSLPADVPGFSNSVVSLDPVSGSLEAPFPVGGNPGKLAVSDNGQYLYVGLNATASVARVELATRTVGLTFPLNIGYDARDIAVIPGKPGTVAIAREYFPDSSGIGQTAGIAMYRDGAELPFSTPLFVESSTTITCSTNPARLYGYNGWSSEFGFRRFDVSTGGVTQVSAITGLISGFDRRIEFASGLLFASSGSVLQPEALTVVTNIPDISTGALCKPDVTSGLLSFLTQKSGNWFLRQYVHSNYALLREIRIPGVLGQPKSLTRWGTDGLAFLTTSNQVFLVRPALAVMDLSVQHISWPTQILAGQTVQVSLSVSNSGSSFEPDAIITNTLPSQTILVAAQASQGTTVVVGNKVIFFLGAIAPNTTANFILTLQPTNVANTMFTNTAITAGAFMDTVPANNFSTAIFTGKADTDRDGLPDDWELAHGLNPTNSVDATLDSDCDGQLNLQEFQAGTDPLRFENLRLTSPQLDAQGWFELTVEGQAGKTYTLESSTNLTQWWPVSTFICRSSNQKIQSPYTGAGYGSFFRLQTDTNAPLPLLDLINGPSLTTNPPLLLVAAPPGRNYSLQASTNLVDWIEITNLYSLDCTTAIFDPTAMGRNIRFYRVMVQ